MARWRAEPWTYVRQVLRAEPDEWQLDVLQEVAARMKARAAVRVALKGAKGVAKSTLLAFLGWWRLTCFLHMKGAATSITGDNLADGLWTEMAKWRGNSRLLQATFAHTGERIFSKEHPETWFLSARTWPRTADKTAQSDTLAGIHADHTTLMADESGGIPRAVLGAGDAVLANASLEHDRTALVVQAGNPTTLDGPLYDACTRERALWFVYEVSGDPEDPKRSPRVSVAWAQEQIAKHPGGREHPWVMVNVLGKFPPGSSNALIAVDDASAASQRRIARTEYMYEPKVMGIDVARFGDDESVFAFRQGRAAFKMKCFRNLDLMGLTGNAANSINAFKPDAVFVDVTGMGAGVYDRLRELGFRVTPVEFGGKPVSHGYLNRRAEMWGEMAKWVRHGCIPDDSELIGELPGPTYKFASDGRMQLESKDDMKKRGVASPNRADALALTFAAPVAHKDVRGIEGWSSRTPDYDPYAGATGDQQ